MNTIKRWVAALGYALVRWGQKPAYVVIYDDSERDGMDDAAEQYYGFFTDPNEAADMFGQLQTRNNRYADPLLCMVMGPIEVSEDNPDYEEAA